jgi:hypothetical protein
MNPGNNNSYQSALIRSKSALIREPLMNADTTQMNADKIYIYPN